MRTSRTDVGTRSWVLVTALAVMLLLPAAALGSSARVCSTPRYPGLGYFTSLSVTGVTCAAGAKVTLAHYTCRIRGGATGYCRVAVDGYSCREQRNAIPTEIDGRVTCTKGREIVVYTYQQNR
jgi:hypothetical protein